MRRCRVTRFAPWIPPVRADTRSSVPPPIAAEVGGMIGYSQTYSARIAETPHWERMARTPVAQRYKENETSYPMSPVNPKEYDMRYLPVRGEPDPLTHQPLTHVGEDGAIPQIPVPVIFLVDVEDPVAGHMLGRRLETRWVSPTLMREELHPNRFAVYATSENYRRLGLKPVNHRMHDEIPRSRAALEKQLAKRTWVEEPWRHSFEYLFRAHASNVPPELADDPNEGDADDEVVADVGSSDTGGKRKGPIKKRKARKIKLF